MAREIGQDVDPDAIGTAVTALWKSIGQNVSGLARERYDALSKPVPFSPDAASAGKRALALRLLNYLIAANPAEGAGLALLQFERANNMSDRANALWALVTADRPERDQAFTAAEARSAMIRCCLISGSRSMPAFRARRDAKGWRPC